MKRLILIIMIVIPMVCFGQSDDMYFNPAKDKLKSFGLYEKGIHWWCGEKVIITVDGDMRNCSNRMVLNTYQSIWKVFMSCGWNI